MVEWRREGLKAPKKQGKKGQLWVNPSRDIALQCPAGQWMDQAGVSDRSIQIMFGHTISFTIALLMAGSIAPSTVSMNTQRRR